MIKLKILLFLILTNMAFAQNKLFLYEYKFIPDSTNNQILKDEIMILNIQKDRSEFYSSERYASDSTQVAESKKGMMAMPFNKEMVNDRVIKYPNSNLINYITIMFWDKYTVKQDIDLKWHLENSFDTILGYKVQKATTDFGGRKWTAWFTKEIPIQDGPYKFKNLPGLILKIEDSDRNHSFELKGIKRNTTEFDYPNVNNSKGYHLNYDQYVKKYKNFRKDPTADLVGKIPDQRDANGNFRTSTQIIKELHDQWMERLKKDNNIIEIDLLK